MRIAYTPDYQTIEIEEMPDATSKLRFDLDNASQSHARRAERHRLP